MTPATTFWVILALLACYVVARWVRARTRAADEPGEAVRYLIRSGTSGAAEQLGARAGLVVSRYSFRQTDAASGPADPGDFYDELLVELREPGSAQVWQNSIHVATPRGLDRMMANQHWDSVIGGELLIVRQYDLETILCGALEHLQEIYEVQVQLLGRTPKPPERV